MPHWLLLALSLFGCTLVVPLLVLAQSTSLRQALAAWREYGWYIGGMYALGGVVLLGMWLT